MRNSWGSWLGVALPLALAACSGNVVDLGGDEQGVTGADGPVCDRYGVATGDFFVATYDALRKLENCREIRGDLWIAPLDVPDLSPLSELRVVEGTLGLGAFTYRDDMELTWPGVVVIKGEGEPLRFRDEIPEGQVFFPSLAGLGSLETVNSLQLTWIGSTDLSELTSLRTVAEYLSIGSAPALTDLNGLQGATVGGLDLSDVPELVSLDGFEPPAELGLATLMVIRAPKLVDLTALAQLQQVGALLMLTETGLQSLDGLAGLAWPDSGISIERNPELVDVTALDGVESTTFIQLEANPKLQRVPSFRNMRYFEGLVINQNDALEEIVLDMPELASAGPSARNTLYINAWRLLQVDRNERLRRFVMPRRAQALDEVYVRLNDSLEEIDLGGLAVADALFISRNPALSSVRADYINRVDELTVSDNPLLSLAPFAEVETFVSNLGGNADELAP
jgi:hypothetical protein